jgi:isopentenyl-diphosphate delta-isomerase
VSNTDGEIFDVVDERDAVIGQASRREVHARGLRHRAVHVLVFDRKGRLFLQQRSMLKDSSPGLWDSSCSGHVDSGEAYDAAAVRELVEEIGLRTPTPPVRWFRIEACADTGNDFVWVYRLESEGPFVLNPHEIDRGVWFDPAELTAKIEAEPRAFARPFRLVWKLVGRQPPTPTGVRRGP